VKYTYNTVKDFSLLNHCVSAMKSHDMTSCPMSRTQLHNQVFNSQVT